MKILNIEIPFEQQRLYCLDWLRVFAILMVFIFHNTHFFDFIDWSVKNNTESSAMMVLFLLIHFWSMPLFFLLAGAATKFALDCKSKKEYLVERIKRLLIPLGAGMLLLAPPQGYFETLSKLKFDGSFWAYYPHFFRDLSYAFSLKAFGENTYHLWFLGFLFVFSALALPLFAWFKTSIAQNLLSKAASFCDKKGVIFLFALPVLFSHLVLRVSFPEYSSWADFFYWFTYFVYGYVLFSHIKFVQAIRRHCMAAFGIAIGCLLAVLLLFCFNEAGISSFEFPTYSLSSVIFMIVYSLLTWSWIVFMLSVGFKLFNFNNKFLKYSSEAAFPFYLLHQTIILAIGFYVVQWDLGIVPKFLSISSLSLIATMSVYDLFIKKFNFVRLLFGMKRIEAQKV